MILSHYFFLLFLNFLYKNHSKEWLSNMDHPAITAGYPAITTDHPAITMGHPAIITDHPAIIMSHPAIRTNRPAITMDHSATAMGYPAIIMSLHRCLFAMLNFFCYYNFKRYGIVLQGKHNFFYMFFCLANQPAPPQSGRGMNPSHTIKLV